MTIVDYGIGNLGSVTKAFRACGAETTLTGDPRELRRRAIGHLVHRGIEQTVKAETLWITTSSSSAAASPEWNPA